MASELQHTPEDAADSQGSNPSQTQTMESPSEQSETVWGRLIPVCTNHQETSLNQVFEFREPTITIGRDEANDITLKCPAISGKHCKIERKISNEGLEDAIFFHDTSTNGTWIDKKKISKQKILIKDGIEIILIPGSKKRNRKKLAYFFHLENSNKKSNLSAKSDENTLESKYYVIKDLGKGAFSTVKLVQNRKTSEKYALKVIDRNSWQRMKHATKRDVTLLDEVKLMKKTDHPNIVKVYEYFEEPKVVHVILDFCGGGDMLEYIQEHGAYDSIKGRKLFKQLIDSVDYLHSLKIAHRDLKPDNILLTDKSGEFLKLSDFGISREQTDSGCGTIIGTPLYQAPEVHLRRSHFSNGYDGTLADYWSLGIILYVMLVAAPPISTRDSSTKIIQMSESHTLPWYDEPIPETAKDLIYQLLQVDPKKRITAKDIYKHPWMMGYAQFKDVPPIQITNECKNDGQIEEENREKTEDVHDALEKQMGSVELSKSDTTDSKNEEEELLRAQVTQNGEEMEVSSSISNSCVILNSDNNNNGNDIKGKYMVTPSLSASIEHDSDVNMKSITPMSTRDSSSMSTSLLSSSSMSRKRKAHFDDDNDDDISKPPIKKQKSDPNGIQQSDLIPVNIGTASSI